MVVALMAILKKNAFSRSVHVLVTEYLVAVHSRLSQLEFNQVYILVYDTHRS